MDIETLCVTGEKFGVQEPYTICVIGEDWSKIAFYGIGCLLKFIAWVEEKLLT